MIAAMSWNEKETLVRQYVGAALPGSGCVACLRKSVSNSTRAAASMAMADAPKAGAAD
jgi:hypothetical protein